MKEIVYGVDFGTTNSAIAYVENGNVDVIQHGKQGRKTMPSVLFFPEDRRGGLIGEEALRHYAEGFMDGRLLLSLKSTLPEKWLTGTRVQRAWYDIEDLIALILANLKQKADAQTGLDVKKVVMGRPAHFSDTAEKDAFAQERLLKAARKAGFDEIAFQIEPIAAALFYESSLRQDEFVLVADFGGGTSDFTLMRLSPKKVNTPARHDDILGTAGVSVAGDKLDSAMMWHKLTPYFGADVKWQSWDNRNQWLDMPIHIMRALCDWRQIAFLKESKQRKRIDDIRHKADDPEAVERLETLIDENLGYALFRSLEQAKAELSEQERTTIRFQQSDLRLHEDIARAEFESMITEEVGQIEGCLDQFLDDMQIRPAEIQSVFLTGGTAYVPRIRQFLARKFGSHKLRQGDAFISVASGLALSSSLYF